MNIVSPPLLNLYSFKNLSYRIKLPIKKINKIIERQSSQVNKFNLEKININGIKKPRKIFNPSPEYKKILRNINKLLFQNHIYPIGVCGGVKGKSLIDMVEGHCQKEAFYSVDIKNFYPSISDKRVYAFFLKCNCNKEIASLLTKITTYENHLPQGFPTSTLLANLILYNLDMQHLKLAKKYNLYRTRWIDDIVFSGRIMHLEKAVPKINKIIKLNDFDINIKKSKFTRRKDNPVFVGLEVNKSKPRIPQSFIEKINEIIIVMSYDYDLAKDLYNFTGNKEKMKNSILGKIQFIEKYNPVDGKMLRDKLIF